MYSTVSETLDSEDSHQAHTHTFKSIKLEHNKKQIQRHTELGTN